MGQEKDDSDRHYHIWRDQRGEEIGRVLRGPEDPGGSERGHRLRGEPAEGDALAGHTYGPHGPGADGGVAGGAESPPGFGRHPSLRGSGDRKYPPGLRQAGTSPAASAAGGERRGRRQPGGDRGLRGGGGRLPGRTGGNDSGDHGKQGTEGLCLLKTLRGESLRPGAAVPPGPGGLPGGGDSAVPHSGHAGALFCGAERGHDPSDRGRLAGDQGVGESRRV